MKKTLIFLLIIAIANVKYFAQTDYYWYKNQKVFLERISNKKYLIVENIEDSTVLRQNLNILGVKVRKFDNTNVFSSIKAYNQNIKNEKKWAVIEALNIGNVILTTNQDIIYEAPFYLTSEQKEAGLSHLFYVKLFQDGNITKLEQLALQNNIEILGNNKFMSLWYTLSCTKSSKGNALEMANLFYESGFFAASEPDLMTDDVPQCVNDTYFNNQWGLKNTGQNGGAVGVDINACNAWQITTGSSSIIVAVLDQGIVFNHPDMPNIYPISFDTESGTSPSQVLGPHGTACAGIIGASSDNNLGVSGIASGCPLMSISNSFAATPDSRQKRADGINFAWQNGASVISNSWGSTIQYQIIDDAITNALTLGRNGLGCVVVFSSGNDYSAVINYPANSNDNILAVGAIHPNSSRSSFSNFGTELDIIAPGEYIPTTDLQGTPGLDPNLSDYFQNFGGTSAACPHVASVAALILSVNPNLTVQEVNDIIERTAKKVGNYNYQPTANRPNGDWNNEMGYGLVNAFEAVMSACPDNYHISWYIDETIKYKADNFITASNVIENGANVIYQAGNQIILRHGFHAKQGSRFHAYIEPCVIGSNKMLIIDNDNPYSEEYINEELKKDRIVSDFSQKENIFESRPNPFTNSTEITFSLQATTNAKLYIVNIYGVTIMEILNQRVSEGTHTVSISGTELPAGIYYCVLVTESDKQVIRLVKM